MTRRPPGRWLPVLLAVLVAATGAVAARAADPVPVIGAEDDWLPYAGATDGKPVGLAVDLVTAAFAAAGQPVQLQSLPYARCMALTRAGKLAGCFDTSRDASLEPHFLWHEAPLFRARIRIYARAGATPARPLTVADLRGRRVAVTNGYTYGDEFDLATGIDRQRVAGDLAALRMLVAGRADHALVFERVADRLQQLHRQELAGRVAPVGDVREMALYLSFSRTRPGTGALVAAFNQGLATIARDGTRARIEQAWLSRR